METMRIVTTVTEMTMMVVTLHVMLSVDSTAPAEDARLCAVMASKPELNNVTQSLDALRSVFLPMDGNVMA